MSFKGLITGTLGYELRKDFLANSLMYRELETFNYDIYSVDFSGLSALEIQKQIKNEFNNIYSGDINVKVFNTANALQYPSDSIRAARYTVNVEIAKSLSYSLLTGQFPELETSYFKGIDSLFWANNGKYILDFKEDYGFGINSNGNREFNHNLSFSLRSGKISDQIERKNLAQKIATGIFDQDKNTTFGISLLSGEISSVGDASTFRNYYNESYDYFKNSYSFSRRRELLPFSDANTIFNINQTLTMNENGIIDIIEKGFTLGKINFSLAKNDLENTLSQSYNRCTGFYYKFYNTGILLQDSQYKDNLPFNFLPLINTPVKLVKNYDVNVLAANYEVTYTNNPQFSGDGTVTSQTVEFNINEFNKVEATHSYDYTLNKIIKNSDYFVTGLFKYTTGESPSLMFNYYTGIYSNIFSVYPNLNLTKSSANFPNIKTKASVRFTYNNDPTYFVNVNGKEFKIFDVTIDKKNPTDIVSEYKIINRTTKDKKSILSYAYQTEKGSIIIKIVANIGKYSKQFISDGVGDFLLVGSDHSFKLSEYLEAIYKFAGQAFFNNFGQPMSAFNWFIEDSNYSFSSEGIIDVSITYAYTLKKRNSNNF
jgi:hypothetical protein